MGALLSLVFFASGAAALLFETLWFRQAGLMLGNSVWATSLVTSSFMGGLALGNRLAARRGGRLGRPVLAYAALEATIAAAGLALVLGLPRLTPLVAALLAPWSDWPGTLNAARFALAFALLLVPATAMGATLPVLARALAARDARFSRVLGSLYGWNTLGAVAGALAGEGLLVERLGMRGTGLCAATLDLACAAAALALSRGAENAAQALPDEPPAAGSAPGARRLLAAAFLAGGLLLALEVIWFRLLLLSVFGTSLTFAVMLAVVLAGIGLGGLAVGRWAPGAAAAWRALPFVGLGAGAATAWAYPGLFAVVRSWNSRSTSEPLEVAGLAAALMLPTSLLSGALFTLAGTALQGQGLGAAAAAGRLTLANTLGATLGPLAAGFLLLPALGIERSLFLLAAAYAAPALLLFGATPRHAGTARVRAVPALALTAFAALLATFPFGLMRERLQPFVLEPFLALGTRLEAQREGLTETIAYLVRERWGEAIEHRLVTNSHSMSGSHFASARYMRLFVYWPVALHPAPRRALLVSYGVGLTAKALTDTAALESIDVVDISKDVLQLGRVVFPAPGSFPLDDRRVRVHVEDGRFFLQTTRASYDLITAEPPPPKAAGIVNLYSREYFELVRARLAPGGLATHWLPVYQMEAPESLAVVRAFCEVFSDCSLWNGAGFEWMLAGSRDARGPVPAEVLARQWGDAVVGPELRALGFDGPELLGTTFLADANQLRELAAGVPPLDDDHPLRLSPQRVRGLDPLYPQVADGAQRRFEASAWLRAVWPAEWRERSLAAFDLQDATQRLHLRSFGAPRLTTAELTRLLTETPLRSAVLLALGTTEPGVQAARRARQRGLADPAVDEVLAGAALAQRDYARAAELLQAAERGPRAADIRPLRVLALALAGRVAEARAALAAARAQAGDAQRLPLDWLAQRFQLD